MQANFGKNVVWWQFCKNPPGVDDFLAANNRRLAKKLALAPNS